MFSKTQIMLLELQHRNNNTQKIRREWEHTKRDETFYAHNQARIIELSTISTLIEILKLEGRHN